MSVKEGASRVITGLSKGFEIAEELRDRRSADNLFAGIFNGRPSFEKVFSQWLIPSQAEAQKRDRLIEELSEFLLENVDPYLIDEKANVPEEVFKMMAERGFYGLKVPVRWGGHGLSNTSYIELLSIAASWCSAIAIVLSADNTIGCKYPVMRYGTDKQKDFFLPKLIERPTGFCLTEKDVGSDPSKMRTYACKIFDSDSGHHVGYQITGQKWFTTNPILRNGVPLADYLAVIARIVDEPNPDVNSEEFLNNKCFGLFLVPTNLEGVDIGVHNTFVGMRGIHNSSPRFNNVFVPSFNRIGEEGDGLKIAFESLYTGRIAIAKGCMGVAKQALNLTRWWADKRSQFGGPLSDKEMVRDKIVYGATSILAMEAMTRYASICFDKGDDVRVEAAAAKMFAAERAWQIVDNLMQLRGGRGYETWQSLSQRELTPPDEILWTGTRPNRIFEGSNELMVMYIFREGADRYKKAADLVMGDSVGEVFRGFVKMARYYGESHVAYNPVPDISGGLQKHLNFVDKYSRALVRKIIKKGAKYPKSMPKKQLLMNRFSRINVSLGAMMLVCSFAEQLDRSMPEAKYFRLADLFCRNASREVKQLFKMLDDNDDEYQWQVSKHLLAGDFDGFLLDGIIPMTEEHMRGPDSSG